MHAVEITDFEKTYRGGTVAARGISLSIAPGEFFGLLGPNGAGKSTTIHCLTGITSITAGSMKVYGTDVVAEYREARKKIGLSPQDFNVDIFAKVWQILDYNAGYFGLSKDERARRIDELILKFDLTAHRNKAFQHLSGGLKRRVMLARALVHDPELIILDEPTAGVDVEMRHDLWRYLRELNAAGKTIILTSHYLDEVELLCDRIGIINDGKMVALGEKAEFIKKGDRLEQIYMKITKGENWKTDADV